jgi:hypothetical protein
LGTEGAQVALAPLTHANRERYSAEPTLRWLVVPFTESPVNRRANGFARRLSKTLGLRRVDVRGTFTPARILAKHRVIREASVALFEVIEGGETLRV